MENPIFRKMRDSIERPCRSKDWFGLAEQAINTIYALGQQPDALCNEIIKKMTVRVFTPKTADVPPKDPDAMDEDGAENPSQPSDNAGAASQDKGDSFELAQLLFVVGHVAIKQIAYLEVVEREMKRQRDEQKAGSCSGFFSVLLFLTVVFQRRIRRTGLNLPTRKQRSWTQSPGTQRTRLATRSPISGNKKCLAPTLFLVYSVLYWSTSVVVLRNSKYAKSVSIVYLFVLMIQSI